VPADHWLLIEPAGTARTVRWWRPAKPEHSLREGAPVVREALAAAVPAHVAEAGESVGVEPSATLGAASVAQLAASTGRELVTLHPPGQSPSDSGPTADPPPSRAVPAWLGERPFAPSVRQYGGEFGLLPAEPPFRLRFLAQLTDVAGQLTAGGTRVQLRADGSHQLFTGSGVYLHRLIRARPLTALRQVRAARARTGWPLVATLRALADSRSFADWLSHSASHLTDSVPAPHLPELSWTASDTSGIDGYSWLVDHEAATVPPATSMGTTTSVLLEGLADGEHWFHLRARNGAGLWTTPAATKHVRLRVDATPPSGTTISSVTHPDPSVWYPSGQVTMSWDPASDEGGSGLAGYAVAVDRHADTDPEELARRFLADVLADHDEG
jgi:hypothetical protein